MGTHNMPAPTEPEALPIAVLLSGGGSTLQNLIDCIEAGRLAARITAVVASRAGVKGLARASQHGIPNRTVPRSAYDDPESFSRAIDAELRDDPPRLICLAGFLSLYLPDPDFCPRVMNIHPALIPAFCGKGYYGRRVHEAVLAYGAKVSGATVHFVDEVYDSGPIVLQRAVPVEDDDTPESLAARVKTVEDVLYPQAIQLEAERRLQIDGRRVRVLPTPVQMP